MSRLTYPANLVNNYRVPRLQVTPIIAQILHQYGRNLWENPHNLGFDLRAEGSAACSFPMAFEIRRRPKKGMTKFES